MKQSENTVEHIDAEGVLEKASLLYARRYIYEGNWHSNLHSHNYAEIFYITQGLGHFLFNGRSCNVSEGDILIINADVPHTEISDKDHVLGYIVLGVNGLEALCEINQNYEFQLIRSENTKGLIAPLLENLLYESENDHSNGDIICNNLLNTILLYLLRQIEFRTSNSQTSKRTSKECAAIRRYIDAHHKEDITLDDLAKYVHLSKYYMIHIFKQETGITPIKYLQYKRIEESKRLLIETVMTASQISQVLGFSSASQFSQCFKRLTLTSPTEFRKMNKKSD